MGIAYDVANEAQFEAWDGDEGDDWVADWEHYDRASAPLTEHLMAAAAIDATAHVLDVGCGNGQTTRLAARAASKGHAHGIDLSSRMLAHARDLAAAEGLTNIDFEQGDVQVHPFEPASFDLAISRCVAMFFSDHVAAFANIARSLRPGGRIAFAVWRDLAGNEWLRLLRESLAVDRDLPVPPVGVPGPFGLADPDLNRERLTAAGFGDVECTPVDTPMWFGTDAVDAYEFFRRGGAYRGLTGGLDDDQKRRADDALLQLTHDQAGPNGVEIASAAWLITATRP